MTISVKLFAILRDRAGRSDVLLTMPAHSTVAEASARLSADFLGIAGYLPRVAYAINEQYVPASTELHDGDELALIPPVSGG